jgi:hypothetical protein
MVCSICLEIYNGGHIHEKLLWPSALLEIPPTSSSSSSSSFSFLALLPSTLLVLSYGFGFGFGFGVALSCFFSFGIMIPLLVRDNSSKLIFKLFYCESAMASILVDDGANAAES